MGNGFLYAGFLLVALKILRPRRLELQGFDSSRISGILLLVLRQGLLAGVSNELNMLEYHDVTVRVRYAETDQMGVVYHSNYLIWFEVGRVEIMRALGFDYKQMELEDDTYIVVADVHCRYHHPARYDELLTVRTRILEARNRVLKFGYELFRQEDQKLLASGETTHIACSRAGHVKHFPDKYKIAFLAIAASLPADRSAS